MDKKFKILVVDDNDMTRESIIKIISMIDNFQVIGEAVDGVDAIKKTEKLSPDVVLMDINMPVMDGLQATEEISKNYPHVVVIIMSVQDDSDYLKKAMLSGAKEYIFKPFSTDDFVNTVLKTVEKDLERKSKISIVNKEKKSAEIISVFSAKGGTGKSVLAFNFALKLSKKEGNKVLLIDGDFLFGDVGVLVDEKPIKTIENLVDDMAFESYAIMKEYITETSYNIDTLLAPKRPENAEKITKTNIEEILKITKKEYDYIIIDLGTNYNNSTLTFLDLSDQIFMITLMDLMSIKNTKIGIDVMKSLDYDTDKLKLIVNQYNKKNNISATKLKKYLNYEVYFKVPEDRKIINDSINIGIPVSKVKSFRKSKFEKAIMDLVAICV
ncbi:MAG TPA: response regulator [Clostridia bacterium]|nr:response regulator [Clostridia bacterium]